MVKKSIKASTPPPDPTKVEIILAAAKKRFAHFGLAKTTMNEIAGDIGMSKASLYYYFPDKEHLFIAVMDVEMTEFVRNLEEVIARPNKTSTKLKQYAALRLDYFKHFIELGKLESNSIAALMNPAHDAHKNKFIAKEKALLRKIINLGISEGEVARIGLDAHADLIVSGLMGFRVMALKTNSYELSAEDFTQLEQHTSLFMEVIIKAITKS